jgi:hypothetical protein
VALVFSTKYEPAHLWFERWRTWEQWKTQFFGYHRDVPPAAAAQILGGRLVYNDSRDGQWVGVIEMEQVEEAQAGLGSFFTTETQRTNPTKRVQKPVLANLLKPPEKARENIAEWALEPFRPRYPDSFFGNEPLSK